jgi:4-amino-4-deoxy-L-arabinose transferase-like glycosyltransferase
MSRPGAARLGVALALTFCFLAQFLFTGEFFTRRNDTNPVPMDAREAAGIALLGLAVALVIRADRQEPSLPSPSRPMADDPVLLRRIAIPAALSLALASGCLAAVFFDRESPLVRAAWLASMLVLFVPLAWASRRVLAPSRPEWADVAAVATLTGAGFWLRYVHLTQLPNDLHPDIALMGRVTLDLVRAGDSRWFGMALSGHPLSTHQILAFGMRLFGTNHYGLVMLSVLAGTATIPVVYLLGRQLFGRSAALFGSAILTFSYTHIHFSRTLFGAVATFLVTLGVALLARGLVTGAPACFGFAGGVLAAAMFTYYSARIAPVLAGAVFVVEAFRRRVFTRDGAVRWGALAAGSFVVFAPMLGFALREPGLFVGRGNSVTLLDPEVLEHSMKKYGVDDVSDVVLEQMRRTILALHVFGDESPHFAFPRPAVGAVTAALFVLGIGFSVRHARETPVVLLWAWQVLTLLLGGILTSDPPYWPHLNILLPAVAIVAGLGGARLAEGLAGERAGPRTAAAVIVAGAILASGLHGWRVYEEFESDNAGPAMRASRYLRRLPPKTRVYLVSGPDDWGDDIFQFFNGRMEGHDETVEGLLGRDVRIEPPAVILIRDDQGALPRIEARYPGGHVRELRQPDLSQPVFVAYELLAPPAAPGPPLRH